MKQKQSIPKARHTSRPITVWIIEDNALFRKNVVALINDENSMSCTGEFSSCETALQQLDHDVPPDVFLLDIGLPGINGIHGVQNIKKKVPQAQIIMVTVFDDDDHIFDALCAGASGYLLKTTSEEMILRSIGEVAHGGSPMNASIARKVVTAFTANRAPKKDFNLSDREKEILDMIIESNTNQRIAQTLFLSVHTVDSHIRKIYEKLQVHSKTEAIAKVLKQR